jgi:hypothetical protein
MTPAIDMFWNDAKSSIFCTREVFEAAVAGVEFQTWGDDGAMSIYGNEVHVVGTRRGWLTRRAIRERFVPLLQKHGSLMTRVSRTEVSSQQFVERIGFKKCDENQFDYIYRIERTKYE